MKRFTIPYGYTREVTKMREGFLLSTFTSTWDILANFRE